MTATRVLLVDDQALLRSGIRAILELEDDITIVGEAENGEQGVTLALDLAPDVVCMDVQMPVLDGIEAARALITNPAFGGAVLMLTTFHREDYIVAALQAGASGFLLKNADPDELVRGIRAVARGDALLSPEVSRTLITRFGQASLEPVAAESVAASANTETLATLTGREREVLELVAAGLSNAEIAQTLFVGEATVKTHVSNLLLKLGTRDRIQAIVWAYQHGVVQPRV